MLPGRSRPYVMFGEVPAATRSVRQGSSTVDPSFRLKTTARSAPNSSGNRLDGLEVLDEADSFLERLDDLLVVQAVGGRLLHRAPVDDVRAAPELHEPREVRRLAGARRARALQADRVPVLELADEQPALLDGESGQDGGLSLPGGERLETLEGLLDVQRVIGLRLGGRVDRRQASADDEDRQVDVQVRERVLLEGAR